MDYVLEKPKWGFFNNLLVKGRQKRMSAIDASSLVQFQSEARSLLGRTGRQRGIGAEEEVAAVGGDRVTLGGTEDGVVTYSAGAREANSQTPYELLRSRLVSLLHEQGVAVQVADGNPLIDIASLSPEEAQTLVAKDGYFGVEQTSERIFQFATSLAGNDPSRLDEILQGIDDGFAEAEQIWGGTLPEISYRTRDAFMAKIDDWLLGADGGGK